MLQNIVGHDKQKKILAAAIKNDRMAHAYLFIGRDGVGKKALALEFARLLNCENPDYANFNACSVCSSCDKQTKGLNSDIILVEPVGNSIKREYIKEVLALQSFSSIFNRYKFIIIDEAGKLTRDAVPLLLKAIEEPLEKRVFILVESKPDLLLATIKSRCQAVKFGPLTNEQIKDILIFKGEPVKDARIAEYAARAAEGSVAKAIELRGEKCLELRENIFTMLEAYYTSRQLLEIKAVKKSFENVTSLVTDLLAGFFYDVFKDKTGQGLTCNVDKEELIKKYSRLLPLENIMNILKEIDGSRSLISRNRILNQDLVLNNILVKGDTRNG